MLRFDQGRWIAIDNGSLNGMYVNGRRVPTVDIQDGQRVNIGNPDGPRAEFRRRQARRIRWPAADHVDPDRGSQRELARPAAADAATAGLPPAAVPVRRAAGLPVDPAAAVPERPAAGYTGAQASPPCAQPGVATQLNRPSPNRRSSR